MCERISVTEHQALPMIFWAPLLHFYQPPTQTLDVLHRVVSESYRPLLRVLEAAPHARVTLNFSGVLTQMLGQAGFADVLRGYKRLAQRGQVELTGTAMFHAILPLLPRAEVVRQVRLNAAASRRAFGGAYRPTGFFPPELAVSQDLVEPLAQTGHAWVLAAGMACPPEASWPDRVVHRVEMPEGTAETGLAVLFRDDILSNRIGFRHLDAEGFVAHLLSLAREGNGDRYLVTALDAETFGHHHRHYEQEFLARVLQALEPLASEVRMATVGEVVARFPPGPLVPLRASSWSTSAEDLAQGNPYPLWKGLGNRLHQLQWAHTEVTLRLVRQAQRWARGPGGRLHAQRARHALDAGLHSCQFWWASRRPWWDVTMVHRGLALQQQAVLNACLALREGGAPPAQAAEADLLLASSERLSQQIVEELVGR